MPQTQKQSNGVNQSIADYIETMSMDDAAILRSIDLTLKAIARKDGLMISQSSLQDLVDAQRQADGRVRPIHAEIGKDGYNSARRGTESRGQGGPYRRRDVDFDSNYTKKRARVTVDKITDDLEDAFWEALTGSKDPLKAALVKTVDAFAKDMGSSVNNLGKDIGKRLGESFKNSAAYKQWSQELQPLKDAGIKLANTGLNSVSKMLGGKGQIDIKDFFGDVKGNKAPTNDSMEDAVNKGADAINNANKTYTDYTAQGVNKGFNAVLQGMRELKDAISGKDAKSQMPNIDKGKEVIDADFTQIDDVVEDASGAQDAINTGLSIVEDASGATEAVQGVLEGGPKMLEFFGQLPAIGGEAGAALSTVTDGMMALGSEVGLAIPGIGQVIGALMIADFALDQFKKKLADAVAPVKEGFEKLMKGATKAANRNYEKAAQLTKLQNERIKADAEAITKAAFTVIEDSAKKVTEVWDGVQATISTAQGYDKAGVQDLWSAYAKRLKDEGLSSVVSSADIMDNLRQVLQSGLSGAVAEEFAYQATLLNNAIQTEDFFGYADTYASIAANAIKNGKSQEDAMSLATQELKQFANNLLYARREIAGGFATSLKDGSELFKQSAQIALTSRTGDLSDISGVLTSVSGIVGAIAPDVATGIVDAVVNAAVGGNSSEITALRSLSGLGASNTAFLQAFAKNPKAVFESLFDNLAQIQNMSAENYMEVADSVSTIFGLTRDAFARVDFAYLADAISNMNLESESLQQNMALLVEGQTTSSDAQLRMQKINEYMIDQGLAYVLDNEVARSIQENMWEEQRAQQIMENTFAVELATGTMSFFTGLFNTINKIADLINPLSWVRKITNLALTAVEASTLDNRVEDLLKSVKVGSGNQSSFHNLTTSGIELGLASHTSYLDWVDNDHRLARASLDALLNMNNLFNSTTWLSQAGNILSGLGNQDIQAMYGKSAAVAQAAGTSAANSYYTHHLLSKSAGSFKSGDWRDNYGYNALYENFSESGTNNEVGQRTQSQAEALASKIQDSVVKYAAENSTAADSLARVNRTMKDSESLIVRDAALLKEALNSSGELVQGQQIAGRGLAHRSYYSQAELTQIVAKEMMEGEAANAGGSFEDWLSKFQKSSGIKNLDAELSMYGESIESIRELYEQQEIAQSSAATKARELHEVQFWEDMQQFATVDFPWYMKEWERYYIQHEAYGKATQEAQESAIELKDMEQNEFGDAVFKLAQELVQNSNWQKDLAQQLKDPAVQTNALLAQIVLLVDAIRQQNNDTSIVSVPTALSSLSLGISSPNLS